MSRRLSALLLSFSVFCLGPDDSRSADFKVDEAGFQRIVMPFLQTHCVRCHQRDAPEGELVLDPAPTRDFTDLSAKGQWREVVNVLNSHGMPPEKEPQPEPTEVAKVVDWITDQTARAELTLRENTVVLRRLNRDEYRRTIRDLLGINFDISGFPLDPPAGGFDNNGRALTLSPLLLELYYDAAKKIVDQVLIEGERPETVKWRFEPETGDDDSNRGSYGKHRPIINGGRNPVEGDFKVMHHASWDRTINVRDFALPAAGIYKIRIRAGGKVPSRDEVVQSARTILQKRLDEQIASNPKERNGIASNLNATLNTSSKMACMTMGHRV